MKKAWWVTGCGNGQNILPYADWSFESGPVGQKYGQLAWKPKTHGPYFEAKSGYLDEYETATSYGGSQCELPARDITLPVNPILEQTYLVNASCKNS